MSPNSPTLPSKSTQKNTNIHPPKSTQIHLHTLPHIHLHKGTHPKVVFASMYFLLQRKKWRDGSAVINLVRLARFAGGFPKGFEGSIHVGIAHMNNRFEGEW